jgi:hypothetical protein
MALMSLMAGEGVKRCLIRGFKAGELKLGPSISMREIGWWGWLVAARFSCSAAGLGSVGCARLAGVDPRRNSNEIDF